MKEVKHVRRQIDEIDLQLARLLNRRATLARKIGALKKSAGLSAYSPAREREVLARACRGNCGPLDDRAMRRLFRLILKESRQASLATNETCEAEESLR